MNQNNTISSELRGLELNALLEVTEAINNNLPEDSLYKIYHFTLLANLNVKKLALFVLGDIWESKVHFGVPDDFYECVSPEKFKNITTSSVIDESDESGRFFDLAIPVRHKDRLLAVILVGDVKEAVLENLEKSSTTFLEALTNIILVAIENKKLARQQLAQEAFRKELEIAKQVQQHLFPKELPNTRKLIIDAVYQPHHDVGGDYYDYIQISEDKFLVCIADVSGKGVPAALIMSNFQASLRTLVSQSDDLKLIVTELNRQLNHSGNGEIFITFFVAIYDYSTVELQYVNCGHNPPMISILGEKIELLEKGTTILGMFNPLPFLEDGLLTGLSGFDLFCYTDGLSEAIDANDEEFGEENIWKIIESRENASPSMVNRTLLNAVEDFRKETPYRDDVTLVSVKVNA